jgi:hypothetical protein
MLVVLVRLQASHSVLSPLHSSTVQQRSTSEAKYSSCAGFDGFAKETAIAGPTNILQRPMFPVDAAHIHVGCICAALPADCGLRNCAGRIVIRACAKSPPQFDPLLAVAHYKAIHSRPIFGRIRPDQDGPAM